MLIYFDDRSLIKGFQSKPFNWSIDSQGERLVRAFLIKEAPDWLRNSVIGGICIGQLEELNSGKWISYLLCWEGLTKHSFISCGSCFSNLSLLMALGCKPLAGMYWTPHGSSTSDSRLELGWPGHSLTQQGHLAVGKADPFISFRYSLELETYGFLFQELPVTCQETRLRLPTFSSVPPWLL